MFRGIMTLLRGLLGRCPRCGKGRVFSSFYGLNERCDRCGARFHHDGSPTVGAMIINMFVTIFLGFVGGVALVLSVGTENLMLAVFGYLAVLAVFSALFYRFARGLWVGITTLTGAVDE